MPSHTELLRLAVDLAHANRLQGGRPFGAVLALGDEVIATGVNNIIASHDPSTHAEMEAIRAGTQKRANPSLALMARLQPHAGGEASDRSLKSKNRL